MKKECQCLDSKELVDVVVAKFAELNKINAEHATKSASENKKLKDRFASIMRKSKPSASAKLGPLPQRESDEPIWFGKGDALVDLMTVDPSEGASIFGRKLAAVIFNAEEDCLLINQRMGIKMNKKGSRKAASLDLENLFKEVVKRNFVSGTAEAIEIAIRSGNQYGSEMAGVYPEKVAK